MWLKGHWDFDTQLLKMLEKEHSNLSAIVEGRGALLSGARIREDEALAKLGTTCKRMVAQDVVIWDLQGDLSQVQEVATQSSE